MWQKNCVIAISIICLISFAATVTILLLASVDFCLTAPNCSAPLNVASGDPTTMTTQNQLLVQTVAPTTATSTSTSTTSSRRLVWQDMRLPRSITPMHQRLQIRPFIGDGYFQGNTSISFKLSEALPAIVLHAKALNISSWSLHTWSSKGTLTRVHVARTFPYEPNQYFVMQPPNDTFAAGHYLVNIEYVGSLLHMHSGFYRSPISTSDSESPRFVASTKFEPTSAREAFPCFDEPAKKANFTVSIIHENIYTTVLSNMPPLTKAILNERWVQTDFQTSVRMSSYLVAWLISNYEGAHATFRDSIPVSAYGPKERLPNLEFSLGVAVKTLGYLEEYFGIPYQLPKLGAMENWGLVTFREIRLFYSEHDTSTASKHQMAEVVAHELAHMWFGNIVTMEWWDDLWLNEGFATFMGQRVIDELYPEWEREADTVVSTVHTALTLDSALSSHAIVTEANTPDAINEAFDSITYLKGSSVVRMLESAVGRENFRSGIKVYFNDHFYGNADTDDLWRSLTEHAAQHLNVKSVMDSWTRQAGYPVVHVSSESGQVYQHRFLSVSTESPEDEKENQQWQVPISYTVISKSGAQQNTSQTFLLTDLSAVVPDYKTESNSQHIVKLNQNGVGFYRVNYDLKTWRKFTRFLREDHTIFSPIDRANLINDAFNLALGGLLSYEIPLSLIRYLSNETALAPWRAVNAALEYIRDMLTTAASAQTMHLFDLYIQKLVVPQLHRLDFPDNGTDSERRLRPALLDLACRSHYDKCLTLTAVMFERWLREKTRIPPNTRTVVYLHGIFSHSDNEVVWDRVWQSYTETKAPVESMLLLGTLASVNNTYLLNKLLQLAWNETNVKRQDYFSVFGFVAASPLGESVAYDYFKAHYEEILKRFTVRNRHLGKVIRPLTKNFNTEKQLKDLELFFEAHPDAGAGRRNREQAIEKVKQNIAWVKANLAFISRWLEENVRT